MSEIKAIETEYNGYRFRSRLEARWAVFFDAINLEYQYEPEGFCGLNGHMYLPDFYFPMQEVYAEVKGSDKALANDSLRIIAAIDQNETPVSKGLMILGDIPNPTKIGWGNIPIFNYLYFEESKINGVVVDYATFDASYHFGWIIKTQKSIVNYCFSYQWRPRIDYEHGNFPNDFIEMGIGVNCIWSKDNCMSYSFEALKNAYTSARQARFEHDEQPVVTKDFLSFLEATE